MKWQHVLAAVAEMARQDAERAAAPGDTRMLRQLADRLERLRCKASSRAALAELSAAFDAGVSRAVADSDRKLAASPRLAASLRLFPLVCARCLKAGPPGGIVDKCAHCGALADIPSKPEKEGP